MPWCEMCQDYHLKLDECLRGEIWISEREKEVMALIAKGRNNESIAKELFISIHTTRSHLRNLYIKLDIDGNQYDKRLKLALMGQEQKEVYDENDHRAP